MSLENLKTDFVAISEVAAPSCNFFNEQARASALAEISLQKGRQMAQRDLQASRKAGKELLRMAQ